MKSVIKPFICIILIITMILCLCCCGKDTSGLGTLDIDTASDNGALAPLGGSEAKDSEPTDAPVSGSTPEPTAEPKPTASPDSGSGSGNNYDVDAYSCDCFDCYIPEGWNVDYKAVDAGGGVMRIYVFVQDPSDPNNIIFFVSAMEPFFTSQSDKNTFVSLCGSPYEWSPVMNELSAAGLLEQWASVYTLIDATGFSDGAKYFKNYSIVSISDSQVAQGASAKETASQVVAEVKIPASKVNYGIVYANDFLLSKLSNTTLNYYISYSNRGFVLSTECPSEEAECLAYCTNSFDFTKFNKKYGSSSGITADMNTAVISEIDLSNTASIW